MHPISPGIPDQKGKGKGKDNDKDAHKYKDQACPRLMQGKECNFGKLWWYSHAPAVIQKAKAKAKPKAKSEPKVGNANISDSPANGTSKKPCIFFQEGKNKNAKRVTRVHTVMKSLTRMKHRLLELWCARFVWTWRCLWILSVRM